MNQAPPIAKVLPPEVRLSLAAAAKLKDPFERAKAIDRAITKARLLCPQFFQLYQPQISEPSYEDHFE